jgi:hypothetical protein
MIGRNMMDGSDSEELWPVAEREADRLLTRVLKFRRDYEQSRRDGDLNELLGLFPRVSIQEGYVLDYIRFEETSASWIRPYARQVQAPPLETLPEVIRLFDRQGILGYRQEEEMNRLEVETLYNFLDYERSLPGLFEYAFFVVELWATNAEWHAAEWLDSTPIFTKRRFESFVRKGRNSEKVSYPQRFGPLVRLEENGGHVRFLVYTRVGWNRIYYLECAVHADGRVDLDMGETLADFGGGIVY